MTLKGKAKTEYMREYMRRRRAGIVRQRPKLKDFTEKLIRDIADHSLRLSIKLVAIERDRDQLDPYTRGRLVSRLRASADEMISHADTLERAVPGVEAPTRPPQSTIGGVLK